MNVSRFKQFKNKKVKINKPIDIQKKLKSEKSGIQATLLQLKRLYEKNEIDIDKFAELIMKYSAKLNLLNSKLEEIAH